MAGRIERKKGHFCNIEKKMNKETERKNIFKAIASPSPVHDMILAEYLS